MMETTDNLFQRYRDFLKSLDIGQYYTRQSLKSQIGLDINMNTLDGYRRIFQKANYIKAADTYGIYKKVREIDEESNSIGKLKLAISKFEKSLDFLGTLTPTRENWRLVNQQEEEKETWRKMLVDSELSISEFLFKYRGKMNSQKYGI
jgi:hypothetical protein